jgi:hypothetical protein
MQHHRALAQRGCSSWQLVWFHASGEAFSLVRTGKKLRRTLLDLMSRELRPPLTIRAKSLAMQTCGTAKQSQESTQGEIGSYLII